MSEVQLIHGDCLQEMSTIPNGAVDMILCDLPYGTTACKWDTVIPFPDLWSHYKRLIKRNGAIVLFGSQPFTSALIMSNPKGFRYIWIWEKSRAGNAQLAKIQPLKVHEDICIFASESLCYHPQGLQPLLKPLGGNTGGSLGHCRRRSDYVQTHTNYPKSVLKIPSEHNGFTVHPTQKPVALLEYLIRTYTNEGETVLDNCMGSGSTGVACLNTNRNFIGIEKDADYFCIAQKRIAQASAQTCLSV